MKTFVQKIFALAGLLLVSVAFAQEFAIDRFNLVSGAGASSNSVFAVSGTIRPAKADPMSDGTYMIEGRFLSLIAAVPPASAIDFDKNLISNPGAEAGAGSVSYNDILPVPSWTTTNNFTVIVYDSSLPLSDHGFAPASGVGLGTNFFAGGPATRTDASNPFSSARQVVDVSALASEIDAAAVIAKLNGYFGGIAEQNDRASLTVTYQDAAGNPLGSLSVGNVLDVDRTNRTALIFREGSGAVPANTRKIQVVLNMTNDSGAYYNNGYADNLSLVLSQGSLPTTELAISAPNISGNALSFGFPGKSGRAYVIESRTNVAEGGWATVPGTTHVGNGAPIEVTLTIPLGQSKQFYRVKQLP